MPKLQVFYLRCHGHDIEAVDAKNTIEFFLPILDEFIPEGLATLEKVEIRLYRFVLFPDPPPDEPAA
ncbi:MAG: DUF190 domain-containing protein [Nitrospinae bacterium]|nr:DUF190 domain-containing protein [Nitrospinota bacterium]